LELSWDEDARKSVFWIADSAAHGFIYDGKHWEQEPYLRPLICRLAERRIGFVALALKDKAVTTFRKFQEFYEEVNPQLLCQVVDQFDLKHPAMSAEPLDSETIGKTLETSVLGFAAALIKDPTKVKFTRLPPPKPRRVQRRGAWRLGH
jgi:hypothetical protein